MNETKQGNTNVVTPELGPEVEVDTKDDTKVVTADRDTEVVRAFPKKYYNSMMIIIVVISMVVIGADADTVKVILIAQVKYCLTMLETKNIEQLEFWTRVLIVGNRSQKSILSKSK